MQNDVWLQSYNVFEIVRISLKFCYPIVLTTLSNLSHIFLIDILVMVVLTFGSTKSSFYFQIILIPCHIDFLLFASGNQLCVIVVIGYMQEFILENLIAIQQCVVQLFTGVESPILYLKKLYMYHVTYISIALSQITNRLYYY